jgi:type I restriction enzyme, S subunit
MKSGWQSKTLRQLCQLISGQHINAKDYNTESRGIGYLTGPSDFGRLNPVISKWTEYPKVKAKRGDILITVKGSGVGKINLLDQDEVAISRQLMAVRVNGADSRFVHAILTSTFDHFQSLSTGAAIPGISREQVLGLKIALPSLPEQQRIVGILDEAFDGIAIAKTNAEKNLQNARALFESHLQSVFTQRGDGWVEKTLESCCEQIFAGGDVPKDRLSQERTPKYSVPIFSNGEKDEGLYGFTDVARVTKPSLTVSARGTLGFTAIRTEPFLPVVRLIVLVPDEKLTMLSFLYYAVVGMDFGNTGTSIPQLTVPNIKESKLHVPSLSEQKAIVEKLDSLREETQRLESIYRQKLAALEALKKSLLHQAFSGQL